MVSSARSGAAFTADHEPSSQGTTAESSAPHLLLQPLDTVTGASTRCFLHELQDELIHLLVTFLGTPTQASLLLSMTSRRLREAVVDERFWRQVFAGRFTGKLRLPSLWRYGCSEDLPLRPALLLLSSLSCCPPPSLVHEFASPPFRMDKSFSPSFSSDDASETPCLLSAPQTPNAGKASAAIEKPLACSSYPGVAPLCFCEDSQLLPSATAETVLISHPTKERESDIVDEACDSVLSAALEKAGVPSGGQCWRGKYFFKHALERKFTRGQFDAQHTWFPDRSPQSSPRLFSDETTAARSPQHAVRGGRNHHYICQLGHGHLKTSIHRKHLHQHHSGNLCPYRHPLFLVRRNQRHGFSGLRKMPRSTENCPTNQVLPGAATVPPVCIVGMKFFGDGAGLVYAARAGGVGAYSPDLGYKLRSFCLPSTDYDHPKMIQLHERVDPLNTAVHERCRRESGALSCGAASDRYDSGMTEEEPTTPGASATGEVFGVRDVSDELLTSSLQSITPHRYAPLAVCVTHTIDDALCSGGRDRPLVLAGFSDGTVGVWDYRRPRRALRCLDVSFRAARGSVAIKSLCMVKGGSTHGAEVLAGADDGRLSLLNIERSDAGIVQRLRGHTAAIQAISVQADVGLGFTASRDRYVHVYDLRAGEMPVASCGQHHDWAMCVEVREGSGMNLFDTADRAVYSWDIRRLLPFSRTGGDSTAKPVSERHHHRRLISGLRSDALRLVSCSLDGTVLLSSVERNHSLFEHSRGTGMLQREAQHYSDFTVLRKGKERQWLLGVDFAETKMATAAADGGIQIFHLLQLPTLPRCCVFN